MQCNDKIYESAFETKKIEELLLLIGDADKGAKSKAIEHIMGIGIDLCFPILDAAIRNNENADLRNGAMEAMVSFSKKAIPYLTRLLRDRDEEVRNFSAVMLGNIANREAVSALILSLRDIDANVRHSAAEALGRIGDRSALFPILELLNQDFWVQYPAIVALGEMRDARAVPYLINLLNDEMLSLPSIKALGKIGDPRALLTLGEIVTHDSIALSGAAVEAIVAIEMNRRELAKYKHSIVIYAQSERSLNEILPQQTNIYLHRLIQTSTSSEVITAAITILGWLKDKSSIDILVKLLNINEAYSNIIIESLSMMGKPAIPILEMYIECCGLSTKISILRALRLLEWEPDINLVINLLESDSSLLIGEILETLKSRSYPELFPYLNLLLTKHSDSIQNLVLDLISGYDYELITNSIEKLSVSHNSSDRIVCAKLVARVPNEKFKDCLHKLIEDDNISVQREAIKAAGSAKFVSSIDLLLKLLTSSTEETSECIVNSLAEYGCIEHLSVFFQHLGTGGSKLDYAIINAAGKIGSEIAANHLLCFLEQNDLPQPMIIAALEKLGVIACGRGIEYKIVLNFINHTDNDIRIKALTTYAKIAGARAWPTIRSLCADPHSGVRIAALKAAGTIGGDKAVEPLLEAVSDPELIVRKNAVFVMGDLQNIRTILPLVYQLLDNDIGRYAFEALYRFGRNCLPWLHRIIKGDYPVELREKVIDLLGIIGDRKSVGPLLETLEDYSTTIRLAAIDSLVFCYDSAPIKKLTQVKKFDANDEIKKKAELALQLLTSDRYL